ncbi:hypothetical protein SAMN05216464_101785 [Mucilaginibacter pineti]|uniref:Arylsulfotransferase (ASST) n=1 Tax=Mucilaginibacter pineti TaxID=1391627 RepID=A0A1G6UYV2_9SPHI|nr:hypothetical protein [Mucilaginibacter pineti]SDD45795.1 hypothetical protein SAMN05216464_101785 [Mucilaginibacter pineti]
MKNISTPGLYEYHRVKLAVVITLLLSIGAGKQLLAQTVAAAPDVLPGKGLKQYDFFFAGEGKVRNMYIVRNGKITWSYIDTTGKGEISDAVLMANGNVLFAHQFGVTLINKDKKVLWNYDAPEGFETHTAQLIGDDHVVFVQNGNPAKVFVMNIKTNAVEKEFVLPFKSGTHGQIRHARLTQAGTLLIAHMDLGKVNEYDINGKLLSSIDVPSVWSAVPLSNGNILVASNQNFVREIGKDGHLVWDCPLTAIPGYKITDPQIAVRLSNGNTLINNWFNQWNKKLDTSNAPVQAIEITPDKKIVWALRAWELGPATTFQLLKNPAYNYQEVHFGDIK